MRPSNAIVHDTLSGVYVMRTTHRVHGVRYEVCRPSGAAAVVVAVFDRLADATDEAGRLDREAADAAFAGRRVARHG